MSHDVGWSLTAGAPVTHHHQCVPTLFLLFFFCTLTTIRTLWLYIMPKRRHNQLTSYFSTYTYYNVFFRNYMHFFVIYINSGTLSLSCYVHVYKLTAKLYRIKYYTRIKVLNKYYKGENNFSFLKIPHSGIILIRFTRPNRVYHAANPKRIMFQTISTA